MRHLPQTIVLIMALALAVLASPGGTPATPVAIPAGTRIPVVLSTTIDAQHSRPGTVVKLETTADVRGGQGEILIPKHAKLVGKVTEAVPWTKDQPESRISLVVERAEWKGGAAMLRAFMDAKLVVMTFEGGEDGLDQMAVFVPGQPGRAPAIPNTPGIAPHRDKSAELRAASDPEIASEVVSSKHTVHMVMGSTFELVNSPDQ